MGDLTDLSELAAWAGAEHDAAFVLVNPLHVGEPVPPMEPSPYLPTTRRFANPLYLRVERIPEYDATTRDQIDRIAGAARSRVEVIDRDAAWTAKRAALGLIHAAGLEPGRAVGYRAFCRREGSALDDFAAWCALSEAHGPDWHSWPEALRHPRSPETIAFAADHAADVDFHRWLQWVLDDQLADAQASARRAGLQLGIVHDLAVGVSPIGADSWTWQDDLAHGITVGAPPDPYAQTGQDWNQPPWRPDRLAQLAYAPFRDLIRGALRHSGGLRVDHVIGLFRLWWIPEGAVATAGTYVRYDHEAFIGILMTGGAAGWRGRDRRGSRHRRAVGSGLPARTRDPGHFGPVVRVRLGRRRRAPAARTLARVLPGLGNHSRPATDCRIPGRRPRPAASPTRSAHPAASFTEAIDEVPAGRRTTERAIACAVGDACRTVADAADSYGGVLADHARRGRGRRGRAAERAGTHRRAGDR